MLDNVITLLDVVSMILSILSVVLGIYILVLSLQRLFESKPWKNKNLKKENRIWFMTGIVYVLLLIVDILNGKPLSMISSHLVLAVCMLSFYSTEGE
ncbi:hypothetical protein [Streptococcus equinus]|uniref:Uncharacterized protein n=1 Tax=Streptococcus equinus TaxID=1335 RepID=A0A1G9JDF9_STREI|nr:hypothetical protein [Streptococcus equinus]KFN85393.1 hypothetical protein B279_08975 [Streptococcus equinus ATCC 33317]SDL35687.1 hypothetical protein SAMN05216400_0568 [Streptococcus equinus]SDQ04996.1 hypothetical protein SAMN04488495_0025 [Streptococcus equinus]SDQ19730.1 hypothetical protein SAMN04487837_0959 [Streptococcus equinus]SEN47293.1 hypothetical protein SAMN04488496_0026 [Streptococcus equinus]